MLNWFHLGFLDKDTFDKALDNVDSVFLIGPPHLDKPEYMYSFIAAMGGKS